MCLNNYMKFNVNVTQKDIRYGVKAEPSKCAIARALKRDKRVIRASVLPDSTVITIKQNGSTRTMVAKNSCEIAKFIKNFDYDIKVQPVKFKLSFASGYRTSSYANAA